MSKGEINLQSLFSASLQFSPFQTNFSPYDSSGYLQSPSLYITSLQTRFETLDMRIYTRFYSPFDGWNPFTSSICVALFLSQREANKGWQGAGAPQNPQENPAIVPWGSQIDFSLEDFL
eukprot:TRINITY_DN9728_c0_g1_i1.p1 TRINITY_DN9728_c0_g1~~TRINITY_DN9728_c0_g1_i1.p1  ORF type:complete len:134 (+),score=5.59 TRINITY_DN9728_c0_g1_i1:46-402(+)